MTADRHKNHRAMSHLKRDPNQQQNGWTTRIVPVYCSYDFLLITPIWLHSSCGASLGYLILHFEVLIWCFTAVWFTTRLYSALVNKHNYRSITINTFKCFQINYYYYFCLTKLLIITINYTSQYILSYDCVNQVRMSCKLSKMFGVLHKSIAV